jgi:hypothetical protein
MLTPGNTSLVRKSAHGRAQLFLPSRDVILREVKCTGGVSHHQTASVYHLLPSIDARSGASCWHCCEPIGDTCIPIPKTYDSQERVYLVYGGTCSLACCKAYIIEHTTYDRNEQLTAFVKYAHSIYGVQHNIVETPPRAALKRFGGPLKRQVETVACTVLTPPLVSYCMLLEERRDREELPTGMLEETIEEPPGPAMFTEFLARNQSQVTERSKRSRTKTTTTGPMAKFVKS